jgi:serine/threonine-protein kinase RsbW
MPQILQYCLQSIEQFAALREHIERTMERICGDKAFAPILAINEAVNNALTHGKGVWSGEVKLRIHVYQGRLLLIRIKDSVNGFVPAVVSTSDDLWQENGRGLLLMRAMMDKVCYNRLGNSVLLVKKL